MRILLALCLSLCIPAHAADALLTGSVSSAGGEKMGGVAVSAKAQGSTITTSVYTDAAGNYAFSPLPAGKYRIWAQAIGYQTAKSEVDLSTPSKRSFKLVANAD